MGRAAFRNCVHRGHRSRITHSVSPSRQTVQLHVARAPCSALPNSRLCVEGAGGRMRQALPCQCDLCNVLPKYIPLFRNYVPLLCSSVPSILRLRSACGRYYPGKAIYDGSLPVGVNANRFLCADGSGQLVLLVRRAGQSQPERTRRSHGSACPSSPLCVCARACVCVCACVRARICVCVSCGCVSLGSSCRSARCMPCATCLTVRVPSRITPDRCARA